MRALFCYIRREKKSPGLMILAVIFYRTKKRNAVFELLGRISATYGNEKGLPPREAVPLCGRRDNYRTNFDDFRAVYLFGIQLDIE